MVSKTRMDGEVIFLSLAQPSNPSLTKNLHFFSITFSNLSLKGDDEICVVWNLHF